MIAAVYALELMLSLLVGTYGQPSAVLWKDQLFVATSSLYISGPFIRPATLYRGTFSPDARQLRDPLEHGQGDVSSRLMHLGQAKLEVRDNRVLWFEAGGDPVILPTPELPYLELNEFGKELCRLRPRDNEQHLIIERYSGNLGRLLFPKHRKPDVPAPPYKGEEEFQSKVTVRYWREFDYQLHSRVDVQIVGPRSVRLFHAYKERLFVSVEPDYLSDWYWDDKANAPKTDLPKPPERELRTGKLSADFTERFAAYTAGGCDYLVTDNGKAYMAVAKGKAEVEVSAVWADPKRRIVGVVQDQANDAVYGWGFVTSSVAPERFYVKLGPKPVAVEYKRTVPLWGDRSDAYLESYECARAARALGGKR